jgi:hypothetical protein
VYRAGGKRGLHTWHNGHSDANGATVLDKLQKHFDIIEQLRHHDLATGIHLAQGEQQHCQQPF